MYGKLQPFIDYLDENGFVFDVYTEPKVGIRSRQDPNNARITIHERTVLERRVNVFVYIGHNSLDYQGVGNNGWLFSAYVEGSTYGPTIADLLNDDDNLACYAVREHSEGLHRTYKAMSNGDMQDYCHPNYLISTLHHVIENFDSLEDYDPKKGDYDDEPESD